MAKHKHLSIAAVDLRPPAWRRAASAWNGFWFTPADPTLLGLMRLFCGLIVFYTTAAYSLTLFEFMGPNAWYDLALRRQQLFERPIATTPLSGLENPPLTPKDEVEEAYANDYYAKFGSWPPPPYPESKREAEYIEQFRYKHGFDLRLKGLPPPRSEKQRRDLEEYTERYGVAMPAYPETEAEKQTIYEYIERYGIDYRSAYSTGADFFSIWMHVTDPTAMAWVHAFFVLCTLLFTIGFCTRLTSFLTWFAAISYIHRAPVVLFGVDTMMNILLLYFMIGPSGAALSVDRVIARWWSKARARWYGTPLPFDERPAPLVSANLALRLIQIHLCIIYGMAGFSKLQGVAWWNGQALWAVLANYEFAPMQFRVYNWVLRALGSNQLVFETFLTGGTLFTLAFEIGYPFLIWRPSLRWVMLSSAILLHGVIGLFMGLKTFSMMMLVMNMAFLKPNETNAIIDFFRWDTPKPRP